MSGATLVVAEPMLALEWDQEVVDSVFWQIVRANASRPPVVGTGCTNQPPARPASARGEEAPSRATPQSGERPHHGRNRERAPPVGR